MTELNPQASLLPEAPPPHEEIVYGLTLETWVKLAILTPLFIAVYWLVLRWLWDKTNPIYGEANWGHAICIPVVGLYYLYINRDELLRQPVEPLLLGRFTAPRRLVPAVAMIAAGLAAYFLGHDGSGFVKAAGQGLAAFGTLVLLLDWGLGCLLFGLAAFAYGIWPGQNQFVQGCGMILTLFGVVLMLCGWKIMKYAWFPIAYLICGIPWPALVYSYIASPLQTLAAKVAVVTLRFTGVNAYRTGTKINMGGITEELRTLNVAEACAGLRSLMTFITVGVAVAFLSARPLWQKIIITISAIPIAIFCNVMRVAGQGLLDHYVSRQLSESFAHQFVGLVMLVPAFFLILLVGWVLDHLIVEEADEDHGASETVAARRPAAVGGMTPALAGAGGGLVFDVPRRGMPTSQVQPARRAATAAAPAVKPAAPAAAKPAPAVAPARPASPSPASAIPAAVPPRPGMVPPRPGVVPPRPGIVPPRPAGSAVRPPQQSRPGQPPVPPQPQQPRQPKPPTEGQQ